MSLHLQKLDYSYTHFLGLPWNVFWHDPDSLESCFYIIHVFVGLDIFVFVYLL